MDDRECDFWLGDASIDGDPSRPRAVATYLFKVGDHVDLVRGDLSGDVHGGTWRGSASKAFKASLGQLPHELDELTRSTHKAGRSLQHYASVLETHRDRAHVLASEISQKVLARNRASVERTDAQTALTGAQTAHASATDPVHKTSTGAQVKNAQKDVDAADKRVQTLANEIAHLHSLARSNKTVFEGAVGTCHHNLVVAGTLAIKVHHPGLLEQIEDGLISAATWLDHALGDIVGAIGDILNDVSDALDLAGLGLLLAVVVAGVLTVVTDGAAAPALIASLDLLETAGDAKILADVGAAVAGKKSKSALLEDLLSLGAGKVIDKALPDVPWEDVRTALTAAANDTPKSPQALYARHLLRVMTGHDVAGAVSDKAFETLVAPGLAEQLNKLLSGAESCTTHSARA